MNKPIGSLWKSKTIEKLNDDPSIYEALIDVADKSPSIITTLSKLSHWFLRHSLAITADGR